MMPVGSILTDDPLTGRFEHDLESISELAAEIAQDGLLHPITVCDTGSGTCIVAGRRRLAACKLLGWRRIATHSVPGDTTTRAVITLIENSHRSNLSPTEEACQLAALYQHCPGGTEELAQRLGRSLTWVEDRLEMVNWPESLLAAVHQREISLGAAKNLARIREHTVRETYIEHARTGGISIRTSLHWLQQSNSSPYEPPPESEKTDIDDGLIITADFRTDCFVCRENVSLQSTIPARVCGTCLNDLRTLQRQSATQKPPIDQNPPQTHTPQPTPSQHAPVRNEDLPACEFPTHHERSPNA